ncbi:lipopolysaccharide assembly protein LapA domain-containing protein [Thermodesulfobacteriota bacterium]
MKHVKFMVAIIIMLVVVILVVENYNAFSTKIVFKVDLLVLHYESSQVSIYYVIIIAFLFGILIAGLYGIVERFQLKRQINIHIKASKEKDKELNSLRNLPITADNVGTSDLNNIVQDTHE